jgi:hypothetical protein
MVTCYLLKNPWTEVEYLDICHVIRGAHIDIYSSGQWSKELPEFSFVMV